MPLLYFPLQLLPVSIQFLNFYSTVAKTLVFVWNSHILFTAHFSFVSGWFPTSKQWNTLIVVWHLAVYGRLSRRPHQSPEMGEFDRFIFVVEERCLKHNFVIALYQDIFISGPWPICKFQLIIVCNILEYLHK